MIPFTLSSPYISLSLRLLTLFVTLGLTQFYESLGTAEPFKAIRSLSNEAWKIASILLGLIVAASFKPSIQDNVASWFFISSSLIQAAMALVCSTILINFPHGRLELSVDVATLNYLGCTVWDLFSFPAICAAWSMVALIVALIVAAMSPIKSVNDALNTVQDNRPTGAKIALLLLICVATLRFGLFMLHIRRLSHALGRAIEV